jgi:hypothetical protein
MIRGMKRPTRKKVRPPAGDTGEKVSNYPRTTVRLSSATAAELKAWSLIKRRPVWRLIEDAVNAALRSEPAEVRDLIRKVAERRQSGATDE